MLSSGNGFIISLHYFSCSGLFLNDLRRLIRNKQKLNPDSEVAFGNFGICRVRRGRVSAGTSMIFATPKSVGNRKNRPRNVLTYGRSSCWALAEPT